MDFKNIVRNLVAKSKIKEAIEECLSWSQDNDNQELYNQFILLKARHTTTNREKNLGLITNDEALRQLMIISNSILESLEYIEEESTVSIPENLPKSNTILFLASNPSRTALLQLEIEFVKISHNLQNSPHAFDLKSEWAVTPIKFQQAIMSYQPRILHFSGHGTRNQQPQTEEAERATGFLQEPIKGGILLEDEAGNSKTVSQKALNDLFEIVSRHFSLDAVILNACYSQEQALVIIKYVPFVIGMRDTVEDQTAIAFSSGFYANLARENDIELAFELAQNGIALSGLRDEDKPVLLKRNS